MNIPKLCIFNLHNVPRTALYKDFNAYLPADVYQLKTVPELMCSLIMALECRQMCNRTALLLRITVASQTMFLSLCFGRRSLSFEIIILVWQYYRFHIITNQASPILLPNRPRSWRWWTVFSFFPSLNLSMFLNVSYLNKMYITALPLRNCSSKVSSSVL